MDTQPDYMAFRLTHSDDGEPPQYDYCPLCKRDGRDETRIRDVEPNGPDCGHFEVCECPDDDHDFFSYVAYTTDAYDMAYRSILGYDPSQVETKV